MAARAIQEKAEELLEDLTDRLTLGGFADRTKQTLDVGIERNCPHIPYKQAQAAAAGKSVAGDLNVVDKVVGINVLCGMMFHLYLPPNGLVPWFGLDLRNSFHTTG